MHKPRFTNKHTWIRIILWSFSWWITYSDHPGVVSLKIFSFIGSLKCFCDLETPILKPIGSMYGIYPRFVGFYGKCRYIYHTWILLGKGLSNHQNFRITHWSKEIFLRGRPNIGPFLLVQFGPIYHRATCKTLMTLHHTDWFTGILIMAYQILT